MSDKYVIFHVEGGCGKNIVATSVVKSIKAYYPEHKLIVVTGYPEVFLHNPNIWRVYKFGSIPYFYDDFINDKDSVILRMEPYHSGDLLYKRKSLAEIWCDVLNIPCIDKTPEIILTDKEISTVKGMVNKDGPILIVQTSGGAEQQGHKYSWSRDLPIDFTQEVISKVKKDYSKIYHVRRDDQPALEHTLQARDNLRVLFCLFSISDNFICMDSLTQHAAAALNKKATVGWISNSPVVFGHDIHNNILANGSDSFRHRIDSYLESDDWTGGRIHECPFDDKHKLFDVDEFVQSLKNNKNKLSFNPQKTKIKL
jgi:hypothetical protein